MRHQSLNKVIFVTLTAWLFKSFEFGNGSRISDENLVILKFKYLQNKKWLKQAVISARIKKSYRTYYFHFTQITDKNLHFPSKIGDFQNLPHFRSIGDKLRGCRFLYFFSLCDVRNEVVFLLVEHWPLNPY